MCNDFSLVPNIGQNDKTEQISEHLRIQIFRIQMMDLDEKGKKGLVRSKYIK